jgi:hypothetical protein
MPENHPQADAVICQRGGLHDAQCGASQRVDLFGVQVSTIRLIHERADIRKLCPRRSGFAIVPLQIVTRWNIYGIAANRS